MHTVLVLLAFASVTPAAELHQAARSCDPGHMRELLSRHPALNEADEEGLTPLHVAIETRQTACVSLLLAAGADPQVRDRRGRTASDAAFQQLPDLTDPKAVEEWRVLVALVWKANQEKSKVPAGPMPWSLEYTANHSQAEATKMLLQLGANPNAAGTKGIAPLADAALKGDLEGVRILLLNGARLDTISPAGTQAIHDAALGGNPEVVRELAKHGANIDARSRDDGKTPLHFAAAMGRMKAVEALIALGADLTIKDSQGRTALDVAERAGLADVVTYLRSVFAARGRPQ